MSRLWSFLLTLTLAAVPSAALAQDDEAIPYSDDEEEQAPPPPRVLPKRSKSEKKVRAEEKEKKQKRKKSRLARDSDEDLDEGYGEVDGEALRGRASKKVADLDEEESADEVYKTDEELMRAEERERSLSLVGVDDPNTGLFVQLHGGLMLLDSPRGTWGEPRFGWGARFTWEFGRVMFSDSWWRNALFLDATWTYATLSDGTRFVYGDSNYHYYSLAPAIAFPMDEEANYGFFFQAGGGVSHQFSSLHIQQGETPQVGFRPLVQYGLGFRGRPRLGIDGAMRLNFRVELTRFRRGYLDDTFFGASLGTGF